jgi:regulation of enolase protein 1 (concanavalin A-like superfamily)
MGPKPVTGDTGIVARVATQQNTSNFAKAGVMIRQALSAGSAHAMMDLTPGNGTEFSRRTTAGGSTTVTATYWATAPYWVRLVRSGNTFTGYVSPNGATWSAAGSASITMTGTVYVGLVVTSHDTGVLGTATLDQVK